MGRAYETLLVELPPMWNEHVNFMLLLSAISQPLT